MAVWTEEMEEEMRKKMGRSRNNKGEVEAKKEIEKDEKEKAVVAERSEERRRLVGLLERGNNEVDEV